MKKLIFSAIALMACLVTGAQVTETQSATLTLTDGTTTVYYGSDALTKAYNAAPNEGATIVLSSGTFSRPQWRKAVSIYGVAFEDDATTGTKRTYINDGFELLQQDLKTMNNLHFEGICFNGNFTFSNNANNDGVPYVGVVIARCRFNTLSANANVKDLTIRQCMINGDVYGNTSFKGENVRVLNCWMAGRVYNFPTNETNMSTVLVDHCVINKWYDSYSYGWNQPQGPYRFTNCLIRQNMSAGAQMENCLMFAYKDTDTWPDNVVTNCVFGNSLSTASFFKDEIGNLDYSETRTYELIDTYKTAGNDGTEIGLQGGHGWNKISSVPRITEISIDKQTSPEGILKVNLKAEAQPVVID